jgi:NADP-dependent 3-hydroxy acid dehydrogenase YdfG
MTNIKNANILITGGASGIGKIMGRLALQKGAKSLIIWDVNAEALAETKAEFSSFGTVHTYTVNIADNAAVIATYQRVKEECGNVDILINNAGIVRGNNTFDHQTVQDIRLTMDVNTIAPMVLALQVLPDMLSRNRGHICNIASAGGMLGNPKMSVYGASKWAVI